MYNHGGSDMFQAITNGSLGAGSWRRQNGVYESLSGRRLFQILCRV